MFFTSEPSGQYLLQQSTKKPATISLEIGGRFLESCLLLLSAVSNDSPSPNHLSSRELAVIVIIAILAAVHTPTEYAPTFELVKTELF